MHARTNPCVVRDTARKCRLDALETAVTTGAEIRRQQAADIAKLQQALQDERAAAAEREEAAQATAALLSERLDGLGQAVAALDEARVKLNIARVEQSQALATLSERVRACHARTR